MPDIFTTIRSMSLGVRRWRNIVGNSTKTPRRYEPLRPYHLTLYHHGDTTVVRRVDARSPNELAISILTMDEQLTGW